jgi:MoxR-like ATPase
MDAPYYLGQGGAATRDAAARLPLPRRERISRPEDYVADPGLVDAVNAALLLGQPLLLTGDPGTGKTQLAYSLAWELGLGEPIKFETKSTTGGRDPFYTYDALGRFQAAQSGGSADPLHYLTYNALGTAILRGNEEAAVTKLLPPGFLHGGKRRSVVLIDEIDKAPRDFPNDLLNELEQMYFRIPELGNVVVEADPHTHPIVVVTSNSEKNLPDAFLRRCVYYNIPFPEREGLEHIVASRLGEYAGGSGRFLEDALDLFFELRKPASGLRKKPATAELLGWLIALRETGNGAENPLADRPESARSTLAVLVKTAEDQGRATQIVERWLQSRR